MPNPANEDSPNALAPPPVADPAEVALFLDVDGTLVEFAERPDEVEVDPGLPKLLHSLAAHLGGALAPVSGRPLLGIDALLGLTGLPAAGLHGAEIRHADGRVTRVDGVTTPMPALRRRADALALALPGVLVEHKRNAIALHYRNAPEAAGGVRRAAEALLAEAGAGYELQPGNHVVELKPRGPNKGAAIVALMREAPFAQRTPWVLGDDLTDEHAFAAANEAGGVSVIVGTRRPTHARYALADPRAVHAWLEALAREAAAHAARSWTFTEHR